MRSVQSAKSAITKSLLGAEFIKTRIRTYRRPPRVCESLPLTWLLVCHAPRTYTPKILVVHIRCRRSRWVRAGEKNNRFGTRAPFFTAHDLSAVTATSRTFSSNWSRTWWHYFARFQIQFRGWYEGTAAVHFFILYCSEELRKHLYLGIKIRFSDVVINREIDDLWEWRKFTNIVGSGEGKPLKRD